MWCVIIKKLDPDNRETASYRGKLREREPDYISFDTRWTREKLSLGYVDLIPGEKWIEYYYPGRWYNIFRIGDTEGNLKGFYCNIIKPVMIEKNVLRWIDMALDIWVEPDGSHLLLDEEEFEELDPPDNEREEAMGAVVELKEMIDEREGPFAELE